MLFLTSPVNKHPDSSSFALSVSSFAEDPGWYIRFNDKDVIFLDSRGSSLKLTRKNDIESGGVKDAI